MKNHTDGTRKTYYRNIFINKIKIYTEKIDKTN